MYTTIHNTQNDMELAHEALAKFFPAEQAEGAEFKQTSGGVNNIGMVRSFAVPELNQNSVPTYTCPNALIPNPHPHTQTIYST